MHNPYKKQDFYWERLFICSLIGAGGGATIAYLLQMDFWIFIGLGTAIGIALSTIMQADEVFGIKKIKNRRPITLEKITQDQFEEQVPDDIKGLKK